jgi:hypothetical protein
VGDYPVWGGSQFVPILFFDYELDWMVKFVYRDPTIHGILIGYGDNPHQDSCQSDGFHTGNEVIAYSAMTVIDVGRRQTFAFTGMADCSTRLPALIVSRVPVS